MQYQAINLLKKLQKFQDHWSPKVIAQLNDYQLKLAKIQGDFVWHKHLDTEEMFMVIEGEVRIDFRDSAVTLQKGELFVIPKGQEHKPFAEKECHLMLIEPMGVINTGDAGGEKTAKNNIWI